MPANIFDIIPDIDLFSFLIGLILGAFLWVVLTKIFSESKRFRTSNKKVRIKEKTKSNQNTVEKINLNTLKKCQVDHLAGILFPLSSIYVDIPLVYPYPYVDPTAKVADAFETSHILPFIPEHLEFYESVPLRSITLLSALVKHKQILVKGNIGSGKTTLINETISEIIEQRNEGTFFEGFLPLYIHYSEIDLASTSDTDPFQLVLQSIQFQNLNVTKSSLISLISPYLSSGKLILFFDGLDELEPKIITVYCDWLHELMYKYSNLHIVAACNLAFENGIEALPFTPYFIAPLNSGIRFDLFNKWKTALEKLNTFNHSENQSINNIAELWINQKNPSRDIFFTTLSLFFDYTMTGASGSSKLLVEEYILHFCDTSKQNQLLAQTASEIFNHPDKLISKDRLENLLKLRLDDHIQSPSEDIPVNKPNIEISFAQKLIDYGFFVERRAGLFGLHSPVIYGYLIKDSINIASSENWKHYYFSPIEELALRFNTNSEYIVSWIKSADEPMQRNISLLSLHTEKYQYDQFIQSQIIPIILNHLQNEGSPLSTRLKYLSLLNGIDNITVIKVYEYLSNKSATSKLLSIIGLGFYRSLESVTFLKKLLISSNALEKVLCAISLMRIWDSKSREILLDSVATGDDLYKRFICELLSVKSTEGVELLKGFSTSDNIAMRKASIYGIKQINSLWVKEYLTNLTTADNQWIVRDSAAAALEELSENQLTLHNDSPLPPDKTDWLVEAASKKATGISANSFPFELLFDIADSGNELEKNAALYFLSKHPNEKVLEFLQTAIKNQENFGDRAYFYYSELIRKGNPF